MTGAGWLWLILSLKVSPFGWCRFTRSLPLVRERLESFLYDLKRLVLVGDWNTILDFKVDTVGRNASGSDRCESSLIDFMALHDLVNGFCLGHPWKENWTWIDSSPSVCIRSCLDSVLVRRAHTDFVSCPTFHWVGQTDHRLVRVNLRLDNRPILSGYWQFNISLLEILDFRDRLELWGQLSGIDGGFH